MPPIFVVKPVTGNSAHRPKNLIWGYMFDPDQKHPWNRKYGHFGFGKASRIRCSECGVQVHGPIQLFNGRYCSACSDVVAARQVPEKFCGPANVYPEGWPEGRRVCG